MGAAGFAVRAAARSALIVMAAWAFAAAAANVPPEFTSTVEEQRYEQLLGELRCLVCQNQTLADSDADLAQDLRDEVLERIRAGESDHDIVSFMVQRYGDFVLYRPPLRAATVLLWIGPFLLMLLVFSIVLRKRRDAAVVPLDAAEARRLKTLLPDGNDQP